MNESIKFTFEEEHEAIPKLKKRLRELGVGEHELRWCIERFELEQILVERTDPRYPAARIIQNFWRRKHPNKTPHLQSKDHFDSSSDAISRAEAAFPALSPHELLLYKEVFDRFATTNDGGLRNIQDLLLMFEALGRHVNEQDVNRLRAAVRLRADQTTLDFESFVGLLVATAAGGGGGTCVDPRRVLTTRQVAMLRGAFDRIDTDGSGDLGPTELAAVLEEAGLPAPEAAAEAAAVVGGRTALGFEAFLALMADPARPFARCARRAAEGHDRHVRVAVVPARGHGRRFDWPIRAGSIRKNHLCPRRALRRAPGGEGWGAGGWGWVTGEGGHGEAGWAGGPAL